MNRRRTGPVEAATPIGVEWSTWVESYPVGEDRQSRGEIYASRGKVLGLQLLDGAVEAFVEGSAPEPYQVTLEFVAVEALRWEELWAAAGPQELRDFKKGSVTAGVRAAFESARIRIFPERYKDVKTVCNCPDWMRPCKHALAVLRALGQEISRDPMILVRLRGGDKDAEAVLAPATIESGEELRAEPGAYWGQGQGWEELQSRICAGGIALRLLKRLGPVAVYGVRMDPDLMFKPVYDGVAAEARALMDAMRRKRES